MASIVTGPASKAECPQIILKGNSYERGRQYGAKFGSYLEKFYYWFVKEEPEKILTEEYRSILEALEKTVRRHFPQLLEEIKGRSDGSGLSYDMCRIMAFHNEIRSLLTPGCSNVLVSGSPDGPWLARNCDLYEHERCWQVVRTCHCDDCHSYIGTGYLGTMGAIGVNDKGLAVGGSSSSSSVHPVNKGLPLSALCLLMTEETTEGCCKLAEKFGFTGKGANLAILDSSGTGVVIEYAPGIIQFRHPDSNGVLVCTNYSVTGKIPPSDAVLKSKENSIARFDRLSEILGQASFAERTVRFGQKTMSDHQEDHSVCQHIPDGYHTIYSWIIRPEGKNSEMYFCWGYPCEGKYEVIRPFTEN